LNRDAQRFSARQFGLYRFEGLERTGFINPYQARVASHIGGKDRG
jgi:hypothetical protein